MSLPRLANFIAFLKEIGLPTAPTEMTFGVSRDRGEFEWAGTSLSAVFAQKRNIVVPSMWRMIFDIIRFNLFAPDVLSEEDDRDVQSAPPRTKGKPLFQRPEQESIGKYIEKNNYSEKFRNDYLIPMTACVWSTDPDKCSLQFPTNTLIRFLWNHHLLNTLSARPPWLTIPGGSQQYIDVVMKDFPPEQVHLSTPVESIESESGTVTLRTSAGLAEKYDHVVIATHGDQALDLIWEGASAEEKSLLSNFNTSENVAVLHSDLSV